MVRILKPHKASESDIKSLENTLSISLPSLYKKFLKDNNGGQLEKLSFFDRSLGNDTQEMTLEKFLSIEEIIEGHENLKDLDEYKGLLVIADTLSAPVICVGIQKENMDKIFVLDWDLGLTLQAQNIDEFLQQLNIYDK